MFSSYHGEQKQPPGHCSTDGKMLHICDGQIPPGLTER
jgi:hypothetical protein